MMANLILELRTDQRKEKKKKGEVEGGMDGSRERERPLMQRFPAVAELQRMCTSDLCLAEKEYEREREGRMSVIKGKMAANLKSFF